MGRSFLLNRSNTLLPGAYVNSSATRDQYMPRAGNSRDEARRGEPTGRDRSTINWCLSVSSTQPPRAPQANEGSTENSSLMLWTTATTVAARDGASGHEGS